MKLTKAGFVLAVVLGITVIGQAQSFLTNGLVGYYPFNGNANDASGNGNNGTVYGARLTTNRFGDANQAYLFGGSNVYITAPLSSTVFSNDFTASLWFNANDYANSWPMLLDEENDSFLMEIVGQTSAAVPSSRIGDLVVYCNPGNGPASWIMERSQQTPTGKFCQIVVTKTGTNVSMYLNSQVAVTGYVSNPTTQPGNTLWIGNYPPQYAGGGWEFHGVLDDIRIYNRALSTNEVAQLYALESAPILNVRKAVYLDSSNLWVGTNYQVQVSTDFTTWTNYGSTFTATNSAWRSSNYWDVPNWEQLFFRLQVAP